MKELVKCVILSHKRHDRVHTLQAVTNCAICVPKRQEHDYRKANPNAEIIVHPDSVVGLSPKIRWVYEEFQNVMMLDDDISGFVRPYVDKEFGIHNRVDAETAYDLIQMNASVAKAIGCKMFGFSSSGTPVAYSASQPFKMSGFIIGGAIGLLKGFEMVLPDKCVAACDYFLSGINAHFHRNAFIDTRFFAGSSEGTFKSSGGTADIRTIETEKADYELLLNHFGDAITRKKGSAIRKSLQHDYERSLHVPW